MIRESAGFGMTAPAQRAVNREARSPAIIPSGVTAHYVALLVLEARDARRLHVARPRRLLVIWWLVCRPGDVFPLWFCRHLIGAFTCGAAASSTSR